MWRNAKCCSQYFVYIIWMLDVGLLSVVNVTSRLMNINKLDEVFVSLFCDFPNKHVSNFIRWGVV